MSAGPTSVDAATVFNQWLVTPSQRENLVNPGFTAIGIGSAVNPEATFVNYWSATFGDVGFVSLTGLQPGSNAYSARFNNLGTPVTFVDLISSGPFAGIPAGSTRVFDGADRLVLIDTATYQVVDEQTLRSPSGVFGPWRAFRLGL